MKKFIDNIKSFFEIIVFCFNISFQTSKIYIFLNLLIDIILVVTPFISIRLSSMSVGLITDVIVNDNVKEQILKSFIFVVIVLVLTNMINSGLVSVKMYIEKLFSEQIQVRVKSDIMKKASEMEMKYFDSPEFYDALGDVNYNSSVISGMVFVVFDFIQSAIQLIIAFVNVFVWKWYAPVIILMTSVPSLIVKNCQYNSEYIFQKTNMKYDRQMSYLSNIAFSREYVQDVKIYNLFTEINKKFMAIWKKMFLKKKRILKKYTIVAMILDSLPAVVTGSFMLYLGICVVNKEIDFETFTYYNGLIEQLSAFALGVIIRYSTIFDSKIRIKSLMDFISEESSSADENKTDFNDSSFVLEFKDVYFRYTTDTDYVLNGINFIIDSSDSIALVGMNGCGKSSIIKLMLRLYEPEKGMILLNGKDVREFTKKSVRRLFSPMFQNYNNYAFTVEEDIVLSDLENKYDKQKMKDSSVQSGANLFIDNFDDKYDTYLTRQFEDGIELSGGQWQKLALSRTIFRSPVMYILDEPSSALDAQSEDELFAHFNELFMENGAILVSHRLSNVKNCTKIIVIDNGIVSEEGTHEQLMANNQKYAYMYNLQANKYK